MIVVGLLALGLLAGPTFAQGAGKREGASGAQPTGPKITKNGKIVFMKSFGGYVLISEKPHKEYKVINENKKVLGALAGEGKTIKIEGRLPKGLIFC